MSKFITLTRIVQGYSDPNFTTSDILFPPINNVQGSPLQVKKFGDEVFMRFVTRRAELAGSNIGDTGDSDYLYFKLAPRDFAKQFDKEHAPTHDVTDKSASLAKNAKLTVWMDREVENAERLLNPANYPTGHKIALSGTDQFGDYTNSDPVKVVDAGAQVVKGKIGRKPNTLVIPDDVFQILRWHPKLANVHPITGDTEPADIARLKAKFDIERIEIADGLVLDEDLGKRVPIWSKSLLYFYVNPSPTPTEQELSFGYCFRQKGYPFVDDEVEGIDKTKIEVKRYNDKFEDVILCAEAAYLIQNAIT